MSAENLFPLINQISNISIHQPDHPVLKQNQPQCWPDVLKWLERMKFHIWNIFEKIRVSWIRNTAQNFGQCRNNILSNSQWICSDSAFSVFLSSNSAWKFRLERESKCLSITKRICVLWNVRIQILCNKIRADILTAMQDLHCLEMFGNKIALCRDEMSTCLKGETKYLFQNNQDVRNVRMSWIRIKIESKTCVWEDDTEKGWGHAGFAFFEGLIIPWGHAGVALFEGLTIQVWTNCARVLLIQWSWTLWGLCLICQGISVIPSFVFDFMAEWQGIVYQLSWKVSTFFRMCVAGVYCLRFYGLVAGYCVPKKIRTFWSCFHKIVFV